VVIRFECEHCGRKLTAKSERAGMAFSCPKCGRQATVPAARDENRPAPPPVAAADQATEQIEPVRFARKRETDEELDMTPMVDVTFLLLIFFMVTAAFTLQKSIEMPPPEQDDVAAQQVEPEPLEDDSIIIRIDKDNTLWVDDREATGEADLLAKLREVRGGTLLGGASGPSSLLVMADRECLHETVVMALDAGNAVGMDNVSLASVDDEDF
jgi:biopolymer transport protein ExbD